MWKLKICTALNDVTDFLNELERLSIADGAKIMHIYQKAIWFIWYKEPISNKKKK